MFEFRRIAPVKQTAIYRPAVRYFYWRPWATIVAFALSPLPFAPIRILGPSSNYPRWRYVSATVTGRTGRYYLLAMGAAWIPVPHEFLILMVLSLLVAPLPVVSVGHGDGLGEIRACCSRVKGSG